MSIFGRPLQRKPGRPSQEPVPPQLFEYFSTGAMPPLEWQKGSAPGAREFRMARFFGSLEVLWATHRDRVLEEWARRKHVGEPWASRVLERSPAVDA